MRPPLFLPGVEIESRPIGEWYGRPVFDGVWLINEELSVVLRELVKMLNLDGTGIAVHLLDYVANATEKLRALLNLVKDKEYAD